MGEWITVKLPPVKQKNYKQKHECNIPVYGPSYTEHKYTFWKCDCGRVYYWEIDYAGWTRVGWWAFITKHKIKTGGKSRKERKYG